MHVDTCIQIHTKNMIHTNKYIKYILHIVVFVCLQLWPKKSDEFAKITAFDQSTKFPATDKPIVLLLEVKYITNL